MRTYRDLLVWQRAMELTQVAYALSGRFPGHERFGLTSQLRRAAISIPSNIAEGFASGFDRRFSAQLGIAQGSLAELETQMLLAERLGYVEQGAPAFWSLASQVARMLAAFRNKL